MPATWGKNTLTNQALTMMNQALGISAITFTKAVTITDDITGDSVSQLQALTSVNYKQSRTPKAIATQDNKSRLGVTIDNSDVNEDYIYYGIGLYAKQNSTNQEVLFSVVPLTAGATMIAKESNATTASIYLDLYTDIVRGTQVTIMVSNSGTLSREDVQQMISQSIGNALNYPNETASIGTDFNAILDISITRIINDTTVVNAPSGFSGTGYLTTIGSGDKTVPIMQTLDDTINNIRSTRYFNSTTNVWSEWNAYAKTVDVNQQLDKKVNVTDMRKPASDVAGIDEVALDNHDGSIKVNGNSILPSNDSVLGRIDGKYTDMNDVPIGWWYLNGWSTPALSISNWGLPKALYYVHCFTTPFSWAAPGAIQVAYTINLNNVYVRTMSNYNWTSWKLTADDSKVVHTSDMRKPASDVAGIEEVNAKQDKIGYTPADDSKVVHDNHDNTITANNLTYDLSKTGITPIVTYNSGSFNDLPLGTVFADTSKMTDGPYKSHGFTTTTFSSSWWGVRKAQIAIPDNTNLMYFRVGVDDATGKGMVWNSWTLLSDNSKVAHLSGANNFDTTPTVNNNPLLLASSLPSDLARTGSDQEYTGKNTFDIAPIDKATGNPYITKDGVPAVPSTLADTTKPANFTAGLQSGGVSVATSDDLKSVENSAWRPVKLSDDAQNMNFSTAFYQKNDNTKKFTLIVMGNPSGTKSVFSTPKLFFTDRDIKTFTKLDTYSEGSFGGSFENNNNLANELTIDLTINGNSLMFTTEFVGGMSDYDPSNYSDLAWYGYQKFTGTYE